jgi:hypothetical protein
LALAAGAWLGLLLACDLSWLADASAGVFCMLLGEPGLMVLEEPVEPESVEPGMADGEAGALCEVDESAPAGAGAGLAGVGEAGADIDEDELESVLEVVLGVAGSVSALWQAVSAVAATRAASMAEYLICMVIFLIWWSAPHSAATM